MSLQRVLGNYFCLPPHNPPIIHLDVGVNDINRDNSKFRVSDAGKCHRMRYWKRQGKAGQHDLSLETQMRLQIGHLLHAFIQYAVNELGLLIHAEKALEDANRIGHLDMIMQDDGQIVLYDIKTLGSKQIYYLKRDDRPKLENIAQVLTYHLMYLTAERDRIDYQPVDEVKIAYICRDTPEIQEWTVTDKMAIVYKDWSQLQAYWDRQILPPVTSNAWECKNCPYNTVCESVSF